MFRSVCNFKQFHMFRFSEKISQKSQLANKCENHTEWVFHFPPEISQLANNHENHINHTTCLSHFTKTLILLLHHLLHDHHHHGNLLTRRLLSPRIKTSLFLPRPRPTTLKTNFLNTYFPPHIYGRNEPINEQGRSTR